MSIYDHPAVKRNISVLYQDGVRFIEPSEGYLACGYVGKGRLEEPELIVERVREHFKEPEDDAPLKGKHIVITVRRAKPWTLSASSQINPPAKWATPLLKPPSVSERG